MYRVGLPIASISLAVFDERWHCEVGDVLKEVTDAYGASEMECISRCCTVLPQYPSFLPVELSYEKVNDFLQIVYCRISRDSIEL